MSQHAEYIPSFDAIAAAETARFEAFAEALRAQGRTDRTIASYRSDWQGLGRWLEARHDVPLDLTALTAARVKEYRAHLLAHAMRASTINRKLTFVRRYAAWAEQAGVLAPRFAGELQAVPHVSQPRRRPQGLSDLERQRLLRQVETHGCARDTAIVHTLLQTGVRVSELVSLCREDLQLTTRGGRVRVEAERTRRELSLDRAGRRALARYLEARGDAPGPLFLGERGPLTANAVQRIVRRHCADAGIDASPGTLRHTFANHFLRARRGDLVDLADLLGHECLDTTRLYVGVVQAEEPRAALPRPTLVPSPA